MENIESKQEILKKINILYVEDEDEVRKFTSNILSQFVSLFIEAVNGVDGLETFKKHNVDSDNDLEPFDIVITDINMPKMDGLEMIEKIHELDEDIPVVITTAHSDAHFLQKAINQRVRGYASKPLNLTNLLDSIILAVEPKFLRDELIKANKNLEAQVEEKTLELRYIIDSQANMICVINDKEISSMNKTMLDFLGIQSIEEFKSNYGCISSLFIEKDGYFFHGVQIDWIDHIATLDDINKNVIMVDKDGEERIFQVSVASFFYNTIHYVVSFTDITELKKYAYELNYQATHDNLTKLYNRQKLNNELEKEISRQKRYAHTFSLIMFDIDNFKQVNDTYGHDVGDIVLKAISDILNSSIRSTDFGARWGGEEFMILLPETKVDDAVKVAEHLRKEIESIDFSEYMDRNITVSIGVSAFNSDDDKISILKRVDVALYKAKKNGKNQVVQL